MSRGRGGIGCEGARTGPTAHALVSWRCTLWRWQGELLQGAPGALLGGVPGQTLTITRLRVLGEESRGALPAYCWCRCAGWGSVTGPLAGMPSWALRAAGGGWRVSGVAPHFVLKEVWG